jgi:DNA-binding MarR family transcriptional regulator
MTVMEYLTSPERMTTTDGLQPSKVDHGAVQSAEKQLNRVLRTRMFRSRFFASELFSDPAWDILLTLYETELAQRRISVSNVCFAAQVPVTTGLRYIETLCRQGMVSRTPDPIDARRIFLSLTSEGSLAMQCVILNCSTDMLGVAGTARCS